MVQMSIVYEGEKHCLLTHGPSQVKIATDAPKDNHGRVESFSPTDLCSASLGACILTVMSITAEQRSLSLVGARVDVQKEMSSQPRRIKKLTVNVQLPKSLSKEERFFFEDIALNCPVKLSLNPEIELPISFEYI